MLLSVYHQYGHALFLILFSLLIINYVNSKNPENSLRPFGSTLDQLNLRQFLAKSDYKNLKNGFLRRRREPEPESVQRNAKQETSGGESVTRTVSLKCKCGTAPAMKSMRIVGGVDAIPHSRPWMAALATQRNFLFCGGTVINNYFVVTAAHCVVGKSNMDFNVILGLHDKWDAGQMHYGTYYVKSILVHPQYDERTVDNDIALLRLTNRIEFNERVLPACLPQENADYARVYGTVTGWGMVIDHGPTSRTLKEVTLPILSKQQCDNKYHNGEITDNMMCAGLNSGGQDACQGDSGGPMVYKADGRWFLIGVVSWGNGCALPDQPGVYTNVSRYIKWIYSETTNAIYCW